MKAIVYEKYGSPDVLKLKDVAKPTPKDDEILIKIAASSINSADHRAMRAKPFFVRFMGEGFLKPKRNIPGIDVAGKVEQVGKDVNTFKIGDEVFGDIYQSATGAYAQYVCVKDSASIVLKPKAKPPCSASSLTRSIPRYPTEIGMRIAAPKTTSTNSFVQPADIELNAISSFFFRYEA